MAGLSKSNFRAEIFVHYNQGNLDMQYEFVVNWLNKKPTDRNGKEMTYDDLVVSYTKYAKWWRAKYAGQNENFIKGPDRFKVITHFIHDKLYLREYGQARTERDEFLFGGFDEQEIHKKFREENQKGISPGII